MVSRKSAVKANAEAGPPHVVDIAPASWLLPNRVGFPDWVARTFKYDPTSFDPRQLFVHQRFVRDFLQPASPYRGLLLFHGLGVGKTCASIAIADVLRPPSTSLNTGVNGQKGKVYVMLPAFLRGNFVTEVLNCGDPRFSTKRSWRRIPVSRAMARVGAGVGRKKVHVPLFEPASEETGGVPFHMLAPADREAITAQIQTDILAHYTVIHYNGLSASAVKKLIEGPVNIFNDSVVIIDEAPNVIGQVLHDKLMSHVYQRIMEADRCKIVLLSGTPLVNTPRELGYIANLVHGYIREVSFAAIPKGVDVQALERALSRHPLVDHVSSQVLQNGSRITATMLPRGFQRKQDDDSNEVIPYDVTTTQLEEVMIIQEAASSAAGLSLGNPEVTNRFLLPIEQEPFEAAFVNPGTDHEPANVMNAEVLVRRLLGCVSVYASTDPKFMPTILPAKIMRLPMSPRQFEEYLKQREVERRKERTAARFAARAAASGAVSDSTNLYRAFSRSVCTFVFPDGIKRPYRTESLHNAGDKDGDVERDEEGDEEEEEDEVDEDVQENQAEGEGDGTEDTDGYDKPVDTRLAKKKVDKAYDENLKTALAQIFAAREKLLTVAGELPNLSPKYAALISHLLSPESARRPAIIYSQFRKVEGLGLLSMALISNGFVELRVSTKAGALVVEAYPQDAPATAPRFIVYGNDDGPAATAMLQIFNSELSKLPASVSSGLARILEGQPGVMGSEEGNRHGAIARLLLITQSGSEGISTKNVREVHIIEPFWHANRILQVVGRAARSNSHEFLPKDERTVEVKVYVATFTPAQASNTTITKLDKKQTSDEHILAVATRKRAILDKFTDVLRRTAVDCVLHHPVSATRRCFAHSTVMLKKGPAALAFHTDLHVDIATAGRRIQLVPFLLEDGREGLADPTTGNVFDRSTYTQTGRLQRIGTRRPISIAALTQVQVLSSKIKSQARKQTGTRPQAQAETQSRTTKQQEMQTQTQTKGRSVVKDSSKKPQSHTQSQPQMKPSGRDPTPSRSKVKISNLVAQSVHPGATT